MKETLRKIGNDLLGTSLAKQVQNASTELCSIKLCWSGNRFLVKARDHSIHSELEQTRINFVNNVQDQSNVLKPSVAGLESAGKADGMLAMIRDLRKLFVSLQIDQSVTNHFQLEHPDSAYVPGFPTTTLNVSTSGKSSYLRKGSYRPSHRVEAKTSSMVRRGHILTE